MDHLFLDRATDRDVRRLPPPSAVNSGQRPYTVSPHLVSGGHAHAGVLLLMSLLYYTFMDKTSLSPTVKHAGCATLVVGILAQSGGFFLHHRDHNWRHTTHLRHRRIGVGCLPHTEGLTVEDQLSVHRGRTPAKKIRGR